MATDVNTVFVRHLLKLVHADVRKAFPEIKNVARAASVTGDRHCYFVEIDTPNRPTFYWEDRADSATHARYEAWSKFLAKYAAPEFHAEVSERRAARSMAEPSHA